MFLLHYNLFSFPPSTSNPSNSESYSIKNPLPTSSMHKYVTYFGILNFNTWCFRQWKIIVQGFKGVYPYIYLYTMYNEVYFSLDFLPNFEIDVFYDLCELGPFNY